MRKSPFPLCEKGGSSPFLCLPLACVGKHPFKYLKFRLERSASTGDLIVISSIPMRIRAQDRSFASTDKPGPGAVRTVFFSFEEKLHGRLRISRLKAGATAAWTFNQRVTTRREHNDDAKFEVSFAGGHGSIHDSFRNKGCKRRVRG